MMKNLSIRTRLYCLVGLLLAMLVAMACHAALNLRIANQSLETVYRDRVVPLKQLERVQSALQAGLVDAPVKVANGQLPAAQGLARLDASWQQVRKQWDDYTLTYLVDGEKALIARANPLLDRGGDLVPQLRLLLASDDRAGLRAYVDQRLYPVLDPLRVVLEQLTDVQLEVAEQEFDRSQARYREVVKIEMGTAVAAVLLGLLLSWRLVRSIMAGLSDAMRLADRVASGDLRSQAQATGHDETGQLLQSLEAMNGSLLDLVGQVRTSSDAIAASSAQIASGNTDLSRRTEQQAGSLERTTASLEKLTVTVKSNADTAMAATRLASQASQSALRGGDVVEQVVQTMDRICVASRKIGDITAVIDGLAFQTNLLALNAAVEAARAGTQGRGFAVVAAEVRTLAHRSAEAARQIKLLIGESVSSVEQGTSLVDAAGQSMQSIVAQVREVSDLVGEISTASAQQYAGISQIGDAMTQLDQVTQQNAALVEQAALAAENLHRQADDLGSTVAVFLIDDTQAGELAVAGSGAASGRVCGRHA